MVDTKVGSVAAGSISGSTFAAAVSAGGFPGFFRLAVSLRSTTAASTARGVKARAIAKPPGPFRFEQHFPGFFDAGAGSERPLAPEQHAAAAAALDCAFRGVSASAPSSDGEGGAATSLGGSFSNAGTSEAMLAAAGLAGSPESAGSGGGTGEPALADMIPHWLRRSIWCSNAEAWAAGGSSCSRQLVPATCHDMGTAATSTGRIFETEPGDKRMHAARGHSSHVIQIQ